MKKFFLLFILFSFALGGCIDDLPAELEENIFENKTSKCLEILDYDYNPWTGDLEINYMVYYDYTKNDAIQGVGLYANGVRVANSRTLDGLNTPKSFRQRNLPFNGTHCFKIGFVINDENPPLRPTEEICIEL